MARWQAEDWPEVQMTDTAAKLAEHLRKLAAEEVAMAELALTNEARARHYAKAADYWELAQNTEKPRATWDD